MNIDDDGTIVIASTNEAQALEAKRMVDEIVAEPEVGKTYDGTVARVEDYGAFVEIMKGTQGLVHVSLISNERVK